MVNLNHNQEYKNSKRRKAKTQTLSKMIRMRLNLFEITFKKLNLYFYSYYRTELPTLA